MTDNITFREKKEGKVINQKQNEQKKKNEEEKNIVELGILLAHRLLQGLLAPYAKWLRGHLHM